MAKEICACILHNNIGNTDTLQNIHVQVIHTSGDMPMASWRCYIFCMKCAKIHEWQDSIGCSATLSCNHSNTEYLCPPPHSATLENKAATDKIYEFESTPSASLNLANVRCKKQKCCMCSSHALVTKMSTMARCLQPYADKYYVNYERVTRQFCAKHTPPSHMVAAGRLIDDRQAMELAKYRDSCKKKRRIGNRK